MAVDISSWPTKTEVCQTLGLSLSQVNNLVKQGRLEVRREKRQGAPPIGKINPKDIEREKELRTDRDTQIHVMPPGAMIIPARSAAVPAIPPALARLAFLGTTHVPLWLRFEEAVLYTGLGESRLRELVDAGEVKTERGPRGSVVLRRADLERLSRE